MCAVAYWSSQTRPRSASPQLALKPRDQRTTYPRRPDSRRGHDRSWLSQVHGHRGDLDDVGRHQAEKLWRQPPRGIWRWSFVLRVGRRTLRWRTGGTWPSGWSWICSVPDIGVRCLLVDVGADGARRAKRWACTAHTRLAVCCLMAAPTPPWPTARRPTGSALGRSP